MDTKGLLFPKPKDMKKEKVPKEANKILKRTIRKSKRSKACDIPIEVKAVVQKRDNGKCIICGKRGFPNSHYIKRSQGGLGIEQNIVCMCISCHNAYDNGKDEKLTKTIHDKTKTYLKGIYGRKWKEKELYYKKCN